jgi:hypothetical protein
MKEHELLLVKKNLEGFTRVEAGAWKQLDEGTKFHYFIFIINGKLSRK